MTRVSDSPVGIVGMSRVESVNVPRVGSVDVSTQKDYVDPDFHLRALANSIGDLTETELPIPPLIH